jgi:hypothetical protein
MHAIPPGFEAKVYPAHKIVAIVGVLADAGVAEADALSGSGIAPGRLQELGTRVSYRQLRTVCLNALRLSPHPAAGRRVCRRRLAAAARQRPAAIHGARDDRGEGLAGIELAVRDAAAIRAAAQARGLAADAPGVFVGGVHFALHAKDPPHSAR